MNTHERFWPGVDRSGGPDACWPWTRSMRPDGYGQVHYGDRPIGTHRMAYELANGPIPPGMHVCHRCDNPPCCNPAHLFIGTHTDNMRDMVAKGRHFETQKTECRRGHLYSKANTRVGSDGKRYCRACARERQAWPPPAFQRIVGGLTSGQVEEIRRRVAEGEMQRVLAIEFGCHPSNISLIVNKKTWRTS